ncbi:MAG: GntR family transcriptional regulator [Rhodospirillales bacterium]|nr:GntR family transcriptional regulator [Rhodospirillales bacterium]
MNELDVIADPYGFLDGTVLSRALPKAAQVYEILRAAIIDMKLPPGAPINKEVIGSLLKVSKTPVSEAVSRLEENGLLEVFPQHGTFVPKIRESDVRQGAFLRKALEVAAVREVTERVTADQIEQLRKNMRYQESALSAGDLDDFHARDVEFHSLICLFTGYPRLPRLVEGSLGQLDRVRKLLLPDPDRPAETVVEHRAILDAIAAGDADAAAQATKDHLDNIPGRLEDLIRQQPELFGA